MTDRVVGNADRVVTRKDGTVAEVCGHAWIYEIRINGRVPHFWRSSRSFHLHERCGIMRDMSMEPEMPDDFATLYRRAFATFGTSALWSSRPVPDPTPADALAITRSLRVEGDLKARRLAEQIEQACQRAPR